MCKSCGCNHINYNHETVKMPGSAKGISKIVDNLPKGTSIKKGK